MEHRFLGDRRVRKLPQDLVGGKENNVTPQFA